MAPPLRRGGVSMGDARSRCLLRSQLWSVCRTTAMMWVPPSSAPGS